MAALDIVSNLKNGDGWCTAQNSGHTSVLHCVMLLVHFLSPSTDMGQMLIDVFPRWVWVHMNSCETESPAPATVMAM